MTRPFLQAFLEGHNNVVSTLAISHDGTKLASGEVGLTPGTKVLAPLRACNIILSQAHAQTLPATCLSAVHAVAMRRRT
jgi:hypothetical protein